MTKKILVLSKHANHNREIRFFVFDSANLESSDLSELKIDAITDIINNLKLLCNSSSSNAYYEWGVDLYSVFSTPDISSCTNEIEGTTLPDVLTSSLLALMIEIKKFKQQYQDIVNLQNILSQAFTLIKANPSQYRSAPDGYYYQAYIDEVLVSLNLNSDDLNLTVEVFFNQLETNF